MVVVNEFDDLAGGIGDDADIERPGTFIGDTADPIEETGHLRYGFLSNSGVPPRSDL